MKVRKMRLIWINIYNFTNELRMFFSLPRVFCGWSEIATFGECTHYFVKNFMEENRKVETKKSKVFTKKLIAWMLSIVMAVSGFFGVAMSAQAYQKGGYNDNNVASNLLAWVDATDDQTLEALLDLLDDALANMDWDGLNETTSKIDLDSTLSSIPSAFVGISVIITQFPYVKVHAETKGAAKIAANVNVTIDGYVNSVDDIIKLLFQLGDAIENDISSAAGALKSFIDVTEIAKLNFDVFGSYFHNSVQAGTNNGYKDAAGSFRGNNSAKFILKGLLKWLLVDNYYNNDHSNLIRDLLYGDSDLLPGMLDLYDMLAGTLGLDDWEKDGDKTTYQVGSGIVYNLLKSLIVKNVPIYNASTQLKEESSWVYDNELYNIANFYLGKASFEITYPERVDFTGSGMKDGDGDPITGFHEDSSKRRYAVAKAAGKVNAVNDYYGQIDATFANANGWDANLYYSMEDGYEGNVIIARYGNSAVTVTNTDTIHSAVMKALPVVWKTALRDTVQLLHVNYNGHDVHGTNFDNAFYYWTSDNGGWNRTDWTANYTEAKVTAWANAVYGDYGFDSAAAFKDYVKETLVYNQSRMAKNDKYNWRDIDASILFNEIRYSPLADKYFNVQTGPLNLYFSQTGCPSVITFFDAVTSSDTVLGKVDDALVAAMADLFPTSNNIGRTTFNNGEYGVTPQSLPALATDSTGTVAGLVSVLINDAGKVFKYSADTTDANILNPYYAVYGEQDITEANLETAIIPFAISALKHWNLTASVLDSDWDKVCDIESAAVVALSEYLKYIHPDRDYSSYYALQQQDVTVGGQVVATHKYIVAKSGEHLLENVIVPMAGDALIFVLDAAGVPVYQQTDNTTCKTEVNGGTLIDVETYTFFGKGTGLNNLIWQTLNSIVCYFAVDKGIAGLANLQGAVSKSNSIWTNIDNVINPLVPVFTQLLPRACTNGSIDSQKLIWTQLVEGAADVAQYQFLTTALSYIGDLIASTPVQTTKMINVVVFDFVKPLINKLLGARVSGGGNIITQTASTTNPIDNFLKRGYVIDTAVSHLITNLYNVLTTSNAVGASTYNAVCFGLRVFNFIPKISDNRIGGVTATLIDHTATDKTNVNVKMGVRNESWGFTSFYRGADGTIHQRGRSNANILNYKIYNPDGTENNSLAVNADSGMTKTGPLNAEQYTRVVISGSTAQTGLYKIVVGYTMTTVDALGGATTKTYNCRAIDYLYIGNTLNDSWSAAFSGDNVSGTADDALFRSGTIGNLTVKSAKLINVGTNGNSRYSYNVKNSSDQRVIKNSYAYVSANTTDYFDYEGTPSTSADSGAAYVAVDKNGNVIMADGTTQDAKTLIADSEDVLGYISHDNGETISAVTVDSGAISDYKLGTCLAGVYLNDDSVTVPAQTTENDTAVPGEANVKLFTEEGQGGLGDDYNVMNVLTSTGYAFTMTLASGNYDSYYSNLKNDAKGLATHYYTSSSTSITSDALPNIGNYLAITAADGVNDTNIQYVDEMKADDEALLASAIDERTSEVDDVMFYVIDARKDRSNVDYESPAIYEKAVDMAQEAENLLVWKAQKEDGVDSEGNPAKVYKRDADGSINWDYYSFESSIKLQEAARLFDEVYDPEAQLKTFNTSTTGKVAVEEVAHATSVCDDYDVVVAATANDYTDFTATKVANSAHQFAYSTAGTEEEEGGVKVNMKQYDLVDSYNVAVGSGVTAVKYGKVEGGQLVNDGYTAESWAAYVDALGETIAAINSGATVHELYDARSHLVMAENNLEEGEAGEGITISGTVYIAQNATATTGTFGARGIGFKVDGAAVLDDQGNPAVTSSEAGHYGEFEITVPEGTTELVISGDSTVDRTVTLSGTADITGADIKIVTLDYNKDKSVNNTDFGAFKKKLNGSDIKYDLNNDGTVNNTDFGSFKKLLNKPVSYSAQALD